MTEIPPNLENEVKKKQKKTSLETFIVTKIPSKPPI